MSKSSSHNLMILLLVIIIFVLAYMIYKHKKQEEKFRYLIGYDTFLKIVEKIKNMAVSLFKKAIDPGLNYVVGAVAQVLIRKLPSDALKYVCRLKDVGREEAMKYITDQINKNVNALMDTKLLKRTSSVKKYIVTIYNK